MIIIYIILNEASLTLRWFIGAAEQHDALGMNMLGRCHENGWAPAPIFTRFGSRPIRA
jgi:hypothetical protein